MVDLAVSREDLRITEIARVRVTVRLGRHRHDGAGSHTVATLPAGVNGAMAFVSNGRKVGEASGSGTGVLAVYSNSSWRRVSDDRAVAS